VAFEGVRPVLHLPFERGPGEPILSDELRALATRMLDLDVDGLVILGLASEASALTDREREEVIAVVAGVCGGRRPFVAGVEGATRVAAERARRAAELGAAGLMVLPPPGARASGQLVAHFAHLADTTGLPVLVQDSPQVTGVVLPIETLVEIAAHPLVRAVKIEGPGAGPKISALVAEGFEVVAGWGGLQYPESLRRGARGVMPGCDLGPALVAIHRAAGRGALAEAEERYGKILPLLSYEAQSLDLLLLGAKRLLCRQGIFSSDALRAPARTLDAEEAATLDGLFERLEAERVPGFTRRAA